MSKTKKSNAGHYEVLFIIPNKFTEEESKTIVKKVEEMIEKNNGKISYQEYWGKKKLAYPIKHSDYGYYSLFEFDGQKEDVANINSSLRLSTDVLRHQIVTKRIKTEAEIKRGKVIAEKIEAKKEEKAKLEKEENKDEEEKKGTDDKKKKGNIKDLDQKLEGILSAKDLI